MNRITKRFAFALTLLLAAVTLLGSGCSPALPAEAPGITGDVTSLVPGDGRPASILVEGAAQPQGAVSDKASVTIQPSTQVFGPNGDSASPATIVKGATVSVWFEGPVAESYPVQGSARAVQVIATP